MKLHILISLLCGAIGFFGLLALLVLIQLVPNYLVEHKEFINGLNLLLSCFFLISFISSVFYLFIHFRNRYTQHDVTMSIKELIFAITFTCFYGYYLMLIEVLNKNNSE